MANARHADRQPDSLLVQKLTSESFFFHTKPSGKDYVESQFRYDASVAPISAAVID